MECAQLVFTNFLTANGATFGKASAAEAGNCYAEVNQTSLGGLVDKWSNCLFSFAPLPPPSPPWPVFCGVVDTSFSFSGLSARGSPSFGWLIENIGFVDGVAERKLLLGLVGRAPCMGH